jgi:hypothetical protein
LPCAQLGFSMIAPLPKKRPHRPGDNPKNLQYIAADGS